MTASNLSDDVFCGPSCVFTNVNNPRADVSRKDEFRKTPIGRGASIGANATIVCGHSLGEYCFIGAGAVVTKNVPAISLDGRKSGAQDRLDEHGRRAAGRRSRVPTHPSPL